MVRRSPPEMTAAEFTVMKALWRVQRGSVADIRAEHARLHGSELAYTTVMTLLSRLAAKGAVTVDKTKQPFVYQPAFRRESVIRQRLRSFLETVFDGQADDLVLHLVEDDSLSQEELERIRATLVGDEAGTSSEGGEPGDTEEAGK